MGGNNALVTWLQPFNPKEILSPSSEKYIRKEKFHIFGQHDVLECWLVNLKNQNIEIYLNKNQEMQFNQPPKKKILSKVKP